MYDYLINVLLSNLTASFTRAGTGSDLDHHYVHSSSILCATQFPPSLLHYNLPVFG